MSSDAATQVLEHEKKVGPKPHDLPTLVIHVPVPDMPVPQMEPPAAPPSFFRARLADIKKLLSSTGLARAWREHPNERPKYISASLLRGALIIIGFRSAVREWQTHPPRERSKNVLKGVGQMIADRITGRLVINAIRVGVMMMLAGAIGGSVIMTALVFAAGRGVGTAIYNYTRNYLADRLKQHQGGPKAHLISRPRLQGAGLGLVGATLGGAAGGAVLAIFIETPAGQVVLAPAKALCNAIGIKSIFNSKASGPDATLIEDVINSKGPQPAAATLPMP